MHFTSNIILNINNALLLLLFIKLQIINNILIFKYITLIEIIIIISNIKYSY
jgi:hypothetical protein